MTIIVGILCSDGVVIGADSATTFVAGQFPTIQQKSRKINIIGDRIIVAGTGEVGCGQRVVDIITTMYDERKFVGTATPSALTICREISSRSIHDFKSTHYLITPYPPLNKIPYGCLVAFPFSNDHHLCEFSCDSFQPEMKTRDKIWYVSAGCGQNIVDPFLGFIREVFWEKGAPSCSEGIFATTWAISHAIKLNAGGIDGPIDIAVLRKKGGNYEARLLSEEDISEHQNNVDEAIKYLRKYREQRTVPEFPSPK